MGGRSEEESGLADQDLAEKGVGNVERMDKYHPAKVRAKIHPTLPNINAFAPGDRTTATHLPSLCGS